MTNGDRIRSMTDDKLADWLSEIEKIQGIPCSVCQYHINGRCHMDNPCVKRYAAAMFYEWLRSEA